MLGGEDRRTLFMLTADWRMSDSFDDNIARLTKGPRTGRLLTAPAPHQASDGRNRRRPRQDTLPTRSPDLPFLLRNLQRLVATAMADARARRRLGARAKERCFSTDRGRLADVEITDA
jgi:hypothetical protein